jgi:4-aminobutyrate aminotransferase-like enzyme/Ser/Thr protein kinase RdoA (MazF antagonist)
MNDDQNDPASLGTEPPAIDASVAADIAETDYGVTGTVRELGGERDQNFRVDVPDGDAYVLKISAEQDEAVVEFQTEAIEHIQRVDPELPVVAPVPTTNGDQWTVSEHGGTRRQVRLFEFVPSTDRPFSELDYESLVHYGATIARIGRALRGVFHPAAQYKTAWSFRNVSALRSSLAAVDDDQHRALAEQILDRFENAVQPSLDALRAQVVHHDLRPDNVLLDDHGEVTGIIDFGDLTHTALVADIAIALAGVVYRHPDVVEAAESVLEGYSTVTSLESEELRLLPDLVLTRLVMKGLIYSRSETTYSHNTGSEDAVWAVLTDLENHGRDRLRHRLRAAEASAGSPYSSMETDELLDRRREALGSERISYREPVHFVSGHGVWLYDDAGDRYLDAYNNVQSVGHANDRVATAIHGQNRQLATNTRYLHESLVELSEAILDTLPDEIDRLMFVNSGSEANDVALQMATHWTGNSGAIVSNYAYHGITTTTKELSPKYWPNGAEPTRVETITPPVTGTDSPQMAADSSAEVEAAIARQNAAGCGSAAFVFDPVFTSDGIFAPGDTELAPVVERIRDAGGITVVDEVQAGFGRTGGDMWSVRKTDISPDIVTMGKPMGNGYPVAAVGARADVMEAFRNDVGVFSTFSGNPVACTAALETLDELNRRDLLAQSRDVGRYMRSRLVELKPKHDLIGEVRQAGLMCGVELVHDREEWTPARTAAKDVVDHLRQDGVLIGSTGRRENVLKIRPPLVFEREHVDRLVETLSTAFVEVEDAMSD